VFGLLFASVQLLVVLNALVRSVSERYVLGSVGALLRVGLVGVSTFYGFRATFAGSEGASAGGPVLAAAILGPIVSFALLYMAHRRMREVPAVQTEQEERASRVFTAWLGVAILDAMSVVVTLLASVMLGGR
jgi:hypothetical protein